MDASHISKATSLEDNNNFTSNLVKNKVIQFIEFIIKVTITMESTTIVIVKIIIIIKTIFCLFLLFSHIR